MSLTLPRGCTFSAADFQVLAACWHAVAWSHELTDRPRSARLLDEPLVLWRTPSGVHAARDLCLHRGAELSLGWVDGAEIVCPYHGFRYTPDGHCSQVPAHPELPVPAKLCLKTYAAQERYGLVWVKMAEGESAPLPDWPESEDPLFRRVFMPMQVWKTSAPRQIENFSDVAHLSWVHVGTFGNRDKVEVAPYEVKRERNQLCIETPYTAANPADSPLERAPTVERWMKYEISLPLAIRLTVDYSGGRRYIIYDVASPASSREVNIFFSVALNFDNQKTDAEILEWEGKVLGEDKPIVESQHPEELPLDLTEEFHLRCDRMSTSYRRALKEMGLGAPFAA
jgi:vanillate O-demethylase monooxygenase subunit